MKAKGTKKETKKNMVEVAGINKVCLSGLVSNVKEGKGVTIFRLDAARETPNGNLAHSFINCKDFNDFGVEDGDLIIVEGILVTGSYDGKNGKVYTTDVVIEDIQPWDIEK